MSAFSSQSSGFGVLIFGGILSIVLVAGGLSAVSKGLLSSSSAEELNEERRGRVRSQAVLLASLKRELIRQNDFLTERRNLVKPVSVGEELEGELEILNDEIADLQLESSGYQDEVEAILNEKFRYRRVIREKIWAQYLEKDLKPEHLLKAPRYQNPKISKIDPAGLMVMHRSGAARVEVSELTPKFRKELDLNITEARKLMTEMLIKDVHSKQARTLKSAKSGQLTPAEVEAALSAKLLEAVNRMERYVELIRNAEDVAQIAHQNDRFSSKRSVPGKLETWAERARKFDRAALVYRRKFSEAVREVRLLDPNHRIPTP